MARRGDRTGDTSGSAARAASATRAGISSEDVAALLEDPEPFEAVLEGDEPGPLAVVSAPYAGRERVLDHAVDRLDATRVRLEAGDDAARIRSALDGDGPVVVDDCQHLYRRVIGGFEPLETALDLLATADGTVVTGWNRYAWAYLTAVRTVEPVFPAVVDVGSVAADRLAELILAQYDDVPTFEQDEDDGSGLITVSRRTVSVGGRTLSVPLPSLDVTAPGTDRDEQSVDPKDLVFERLAGVADGNVGVASAIWERQRDDVVRPSDIGVPESNLALDRETAFCLRVIVAKERLRREELAALIADLDRVLAPLVRNDVVSVEEGWIWLSPAAVPTVVEHTEGAGIL